MAEGLPLSLVTCWLILRSHDLAFARFFSRCHFVHREGSGMMLAGEERVGIYIFENGSCKGTGKGKESGRA